VQAEGILLGWVSGPSNTTAAPESLSVCGTLRQVASTVVQQWLGALLSHVQSLTEAPPPPPAIIYKEVRVEAPEEAAERAQRRERAALDAAPLPPGGLQLPPSPRGARSSRPGRPAAVLVPSASTVPELLQLPAPLVLLPPPPSLQLLSSPPHARLPPCPIVALSSAASRRVAHGGDGAGSVSQLLPAVNLLAPTPAVATPSIESLLAPQPSCAPPASPQPLSIALPLSPAVTPLSAAVMPPQHTPQATVSLNSLAAEEPRDASFKHRDAPPAAMPTATSPVPQDSPSPDYKEANRSHKAKLDKERAFVDSEGGTVLKNKTRSGGKLSSGGKEALGVKPSPKKPTHPPLLIGASVLNKNGKKLGKGDALPKTPLGKGRKLCHVCGTVVGSPTRVCPHCHASLPFKTHQ
jgi:hypothetical protein